MDFRHTGRAVPLGGGCDDENGAASVQHRIAVEADDGRGAADRRGARVYVCGDGDRMAPAVREAFRTLYRERTPGADEAAAQRWLDTRAADGRCAEDGCAAG